MSDREQYRAEADQQKQETFKQETQSPGGVCPGCGRCKECGRPYQVQPSPQIPSPWGPWSNYPTPWASGTTWGGLPPTITYTS
jgi:hypothetical protein